MRKDSVPNLRGKSYPGGGSEVDKDFRIDALELNVARLAEMQREMTATLERIEKVFLLVYRDVKCIHPDRRSGFQGKFKQRSSKIGR